LKKETLVLLHGWGCDSASWQPILAQLQELGEVIAIDLPGFGKNSDTDIFLLETVVDYIAAQLPDGCVLIGWSLGGMLAVQIAARYPSTVSRIITLAANVKFVANDDYAYAMSIKTNQDFNHFFETDACAALKLFSGLLAQGDVNERALLKKMRDLIDSECVNSCWHQALRVLASIDNRSVFAALNQPGLHMFGEADALVPVTAASNLKSLNRKQNIQVMPRAAHALHWSQPQEVVKHIKVFISSSGNTSLSADSTQKKRIARSFSRAATTYDSVAEFQRAVGEKLLKKIKTSEVIQEAGLVVDLGCGTGYFGEPLQMLFPKANIIGVDLAEGMLQAARARNKEHFSWLCGDAENLPLANACADVIFSNLALQWCHNLQGLFSELNRILKPGGVLFFSTLGPMTLHELRSAWSKVDCYAHVNLFKPIEQVHRSLQKNRFSVLESQGDTNVLAFEKLTDLTRSLKDLGAHNVNREQLQGLTGRKKIAAFKSAYENYRQGAFLPATYDVFYVSAKMSNAQ
jgi:malonyl-CoA O-methyltransferase